MSKQTKRTKEKRQGAPNQTGVKVAQFFKKNIYVILMIICILAIATMITLAVVLNNNNDGDTVMKPIVSGDEEPSNNPPIVDPDQNKPSDPDDSKDPDDSITKPPAKQDFVMADPIDKYTFGQVYSEEHVYSNTHNYWHPHEGLDLHAEVGSDVKCVFDGTVKEVTNDSYYGSTVTISHQDGFTTVYKLLDGVSLKVGDKISKGDVIGKVSDTALDEIMDGAHVHLELYKNGVAIDPMSYLLSGDK